MLEYDIKYQSYVRSSSTIEIKYRSTLIEALWSEYGK
nr:MAG TPA: hypothetical protein [Caudoviricetes sp.]